MITRREYELLCRRVDTLQAQLALRPVLIPPGGNAQPTRTLLITGGNTLSDGSTLGIKYVSAGVSAVPSLYDPNVTTTFIDGIGRAQLMVNGVLQSGYVLVVHSPLSGGITDALFANDLCLASPVKSNIPVTGDPNNATVSCYIPLMP